MSKLIRFGLAALVAASMFSATPASAAVRSGRCGQGSQWKMNVGFDDGRLDGEFEVDQNLRNRRWEITIRDNGRLVFSGVRRTGIRSGSWSVNFRGANLAGRDRVVGRARALGTGERCFGVARTLR